jgi:hypothetical protein
VDSLNWQEMIWQPPGSGEQTLEVSAWGQPVRVVGSPMEGVLQNGQVSFADVDVFHVAEGETSFDLDNPPFSVQGVLGNGLFFDRFLVVLVLSQPDGRLGLIEAGGE